MTPVENLILFFFVNIKCCNRVWTLTPENRSQRQLWAAQQVKQDKVSPQDTPTHISMNSLARTKVFQSYNITRLQYKNNSHKLESYLQNIWKAPQRRTDYTKHCYTDGKEMLTFIIKQILVNFHCPRQINRCIVYLYGSLELILIQPWNSRHPLSKRYRFLKSITSQCL